MGRHFLLFLLFRFALFGLLSRLLFAHGRAVLGPWRLVLPHGSPLSQPQSPLSFVLLSPLDLLPDLPLLAAIREEGVKIEVDDGFSDGDDAVATFEAA